MTDIERRLLHAAYQKVPASPKELRWLCEAAAFEIARLHELLADLQGESFTSPPLWEEERG